ncbi:threonine aldolase [Pedobacter yulinensis]|uniref:Threonine aldolase n=2 Tax=Pedobacter yulinensis TaxID=2126353 RepID=A0A2T3HJ25_9SPHI|nr:threonine aldolase [Pedobacter yulinensis]
MREIIDMRSDTVTRPTAGMLDAMFSARVGDDVFGEDETVRALEEKAAAIFGMEAGLFCPSGTMTNQIAIKCFTKPMDEVICDQTAHVYRYEVGGIAWNSAASVRLLHGDRGILSPELIEPEINEDNIHYPDTTLVVLENTVNKGGGACYHLNQIEPIHNLCSIKGLKLHLDGARIFNALAATGDKALHYGRYFDGISICLSKGLGAPVGSVLLGSKEMIGRARKIRKAMGGGMRQAGFLAAAGIYALDHHVGRLKEDHAHAHALAEALAGAAWVRSILPAETNIVVFEVDPRIQVKTLVKQFADKGLLCNATGPHTVRMVTHLDVNQQQVDQAREIILHLNPA